MFGKKPETASTDDLKQLFGSKKGTPTATAPTNTNPVDSYNSKVKTQHEVDAFTAKVQAYPKSVAESAMALLEQVRSSSDTNGSAAPKGFFNQFVDGNAYKPELSAVATYLFKNWHEQVMDNGGREIEKLVEACVELKRYLDAKGNPALKEFAGYFLDALGVSYAGFLTRQAPESEQLIRKKMREFRSICKKALLIKESENTQQAAAPQMQGTSTDFFTTLQNNGTTVQKLMQEISDKDGIRFYAEDGTTFVKIANYTYPLLKKLKQALQVGQEAEFDYDANFVVSIAKQSKSYSAAAVPSFAGSVANVVFAGFHKYDTTDLDMGDRISLFKFGSQLRATIESAIGEIIAPELQSTVDMGRLSSGLPWFDQAGIEDLEFLALKACANNLYNYDTENGSDLYQKRMHQLGEIGKTPFGKAMFYAAMGLRVIVDNGGMESATHVLPGFKLIADWIAEQPNKDELFHFMNVPASIIDSIENKTPAFSAAFQDVIGYLSSRYNEPQSIKGDMNRAFEAMEKLQQGLEQIPGIDPKDVARLREMLNKRNQ